MKKSTLYRFAQQAVVSSELNATSKIEVLRLLFKDEELALYTEKMEAENDGEL